MSWYVVAQIMIQPVLPPAPASASASASVRILEATTASRDDWARPGGAQRTEIVIVEKDGRKTPVRLIEHQ